MGLTYDDDLNNGDDAAAIFADNALKAMLLQIYMIDWLCELQPGLIVGDRCHVDSIVLVSIQGSGSG